MLVVKNPPANAEDTRDKGSVPGSRRSPGRRNGNPLQYSCPKNPMDRGAWRDTVHRVAKSQTRLQWLSTHTTMEHDTNFANTVVQSIGHLQLFCNPVYCSMPGFSVHHQLLDLAQTHVHRVNDAIQQSHPLSSPSPPAFNLSQHQNLF